MWKQREDIFEYIKGRLLYFPLKVQVHRAYSTLNGP